MLKSSWLLPLWTKTFVCIKIRVGYSWREGSSGGISSQWLVVDPLPALLCGRGDGLLSRPEYALATCHVPRRTVYKLSKGVAQNVTEDFWRSPTRWGSRGTRKWKMPAYFLSKLWFCGTTTAKMSWWNVRASRAARNQQFSAPRQMDTCSWLKSESCQPSSGTPPRC